LPLSAGNYNCLRRARLLKRVLEQFGIEEERFRLEWISAAEGDRVRVVIDDMVEKLRKLGPLQLKRGRPSSAAVLASRYRRRWAYDPGET